MTGNRSNERLDMNKKPAIFFVVYFFLSTVTAAQINPLILEQFINKEASFNSISFQYPAETKTFYKKQGHHSVWTGNDLLIAELLNLLKQSTSLGLNEKDYQPVLIASLSTKTYRVDDISDSIVMELRLTDAAIHFIHDILYGNMTPAVGYNGLNYSPACADIPSILQSAISNRQLLSLPAAIEQRTPEYIAIREKIIRYSRMISDSTFKETTITSAKVNSDNIPLLQRLFQLGFIDSVKQKLPDTLLKVKVKAAQKLFSLLQDGVMRSTSLDAFNVPLAARLKELNRALNTIRWLSCIKQSQKVIVVNLPSATLLVYDDDKVVLESRIIVGKRSTPTPMLISKVTEVILYPYWMVPYSIATKELLPSIKRNPGYLDANGYQVINLQGKVINPYAVNWGTLSRSYFPYIIRQSTGCDNALGLVKLNFYNPYSVYLHDTPNKSLFGLNKRYFSHGCMRVQKAMELGRFVLKNNTVAIDTLTEKGCLHNQSPIIVPADESIPVFVLYNTAWVDAAGHVSFSEDMYRKNSAAFKSN
jgi:murein L,D-transpeptidase YcbB/YkuD